MRKDRDESIVDVRAMCEDIKSDKYWTKQDDSSLKRLIKKFRSLENDVYDAGDYRNPYWVVLRCVCHDFNVMLGSIPYWIKDASIKKHRGKVNKVLQQYLHNAQCLADGGTDEVVEGYTYLRRGGKYAISTCIAEYEPKRKEYHALGIVTKDRIPSIRKWLKETKWLSESSREWADNALKELDEKKEIVGNNWKVFYD